MVKSLCFCCKGQGLDHCLGNWDAICHKAKKKKKNDGIPSKGLHTASLLLNVGEIICFSRGPQMVYLYDFTFLIHVSSPPELLFLWILII